MYKIAVCGEVFSENLGDGVIAESLGYLISSILPCSRITYMDISGRTGWNGGTGAQGAAIARRGIGRQFGFGLNLYGRSRTFRRGHALLRMLAAEADGDRSGMPPEAFDLAIVGGGQLVMDNELNFPTKIFSLARRLGGGTKALAFHSCGVGETWSTAGRWLVRGVLRDPRVIGRSVRDEASRRNLAGTFRIDSGEIALVYDPALWAADAYGVTRARGTGVIGLGIMAPLSGAADVSPGNAAKFERGFLTNLWAETAVRVGAEGHRVTLFTNGSPSDQAFAEAVLSAIPPTRRAGITLCPRPRTPEQLVRTVAGFEAIVAQRLHAHIISFSLGVPSVGLIWDNKVREFGALTGRSRFFLEPGAFAASSLAEGICRALTEDEDPERRWRLQQGVHAGTLRLLQRAGLANATV